MLFSLKRWPPLAARPENARKILGGGGDVGEDSDSRYGHLNSISRHQFFAQVYNVYCDRYVLHRVFPVIVYYCALYLILFC